MGGFYKFENEKVDLHNLAKPQKGLHIIFFQIILFAFLWLVMFPFI